MDSPERKPGVSQYGSVDPAPPSNETDISLLRNTLLDEDEKMFERMRVCLLYTSPSPRDMRRSRMPSSA